MGDILKIKYKVEKDKTKLWIMDSNTGRIVHEQPFSMNPYPLVGLNHFILHLLQTYLF